MQEVYILPLTKPGLRHLLQLSKKSNIRLKEEIILIEVGVGGSPPIKGTVVTNMFSGACRQSWPIIAHGFVFVIVLFTTFLCVSHIERI